MNFSVSLIGFVVVWVVVFFAPTSLTMYEVPDTKVYQNNKPYYPEFNSSLNNITTSIAANKLVHTSMFGLGHRTAKISCAWHLTKSLNLTQMHLIWPDCGSEGKGNIFPMLFDSNIIHTSIEPQSNGNSDAVSKTISVENDVDGCYGANNYKIHQVPIYQNNTQSFANKISSDLELYQILRATFKGKQEIINFMSKHNFRDHYVIGLHIRLGNGEGTNFAEQGRGVDNEWTFIYNLVDLIHHFLEEMQVTHPDRLRRKPMIFLATDSPKFLPYLVNDTGLPIVVMPQKRVESGVTFSAFREGHQCIKGWYDQLLDNILLSFSDVLIAARHSSFTQGLPISLVFDQGGSFCEVSDSAEAMTCIDDMSTWMYRNDDSKTHHYGIHNKTEEHVNHGGGHVHLPDVVISNEYKKAEQFLKVKGGQNTMKYGARFSQKYRWAPKCKDCTNFNIISE